MERPTIANRLKLLRILAGLSQNDLAEALSIPQSKIVYYETGKVRPRKKIIKEFATYFGCSPGWLSEDEPNAFRFFWSVLPPPRYRHLNRMVRDAESVVRQLLPIFCKENNVRRAFLFSAEFGSVFALEFGGEMYSRFLTIKAETSTAEVLYNALHNNGIKILPVTTERIPDNAWKHLFNTESSLSENESSLRYILNNIKLKIPERLPDIQLALYVNSYKERFISKEKTTTWSFSCNITVTRDDGLDRNQALQEISSMVSQYCSDSGARVRVLFNKFCDKKSKQQ